ERCDGNDTLLCAGDDLVRTPCGSSATCVDTGTPTCEPHLCTPGSVECNMDATGIETCAADGLSSTPTPCARGCATNACRPETACANTVQGVVGIGTTLAIDLCTGSSDYDVDPVIGCPRGANGNDRLYRLELDRMSRLRIEVNVTSATATDPVVTLRSACAVETSQTHCDSNDGPGLQPRLDVDLGAGDYFLVVDSYNYTFMSTTYVCGQVELRITER
ncbi:MAG: hypothetical protein K8H88_25055, partial [Sandaracinaceae bacterium]|nr:hypothetical protein [Sandaracinaceae bacterium]